MEYIEVMEITNCCSIGFLLPFWFFIRFGKLGPNRIYFDLRKYG